ncbi:MAG: hypothetical protein K9H25_07005 [Rhodospirillum sp.]|nr:hypothetical protein [Rhodospirillum sp.]MCF8487754.1 hypothetical protein [Rhodospirillum sp.]MCF8502822.1 hypothetical protein [Rhodospirillum sp.]
MKKLLKLGLIVIVALLVVGGGVVGAMKFGFVPDVLGLFSTEGAAEPKELTPLEQFGQPPFLMSMKPIEIPVIMNGQVVRRSNFRFRIQIDPKDAAMFQYAGHKLHAEMFEALMGFLPRHLETRDRVDLMAVKQRMRKVADLVLGMGKVKDVLIQGYFER